MGEKTDISNLERLRALQKVSVALMQTRNLDELLQMILDESLKLLSCDAGSIFLAESAKSMRFHLTKTQSFPTNFKKTSLSTEGSGIAAYVFRTGEQVCIDDVYHLKPEDPYEFDSSFDYQSGYRTKSMIAQPLRNRDGRVMGVLQFMNRKNHYLDLWTSKDSKKIAEFPGFDEEDMRLLESFAGVASASLENVQLTEEIEKLFDAFVTACVHTIESRDASTRGHSERVTILTLELAKRVNQITEGPLAPIHFSGEELEELKYAGLLHDFGKIAVPESIFMKEEKLSREQQLNLKLRIEEFKAASQQRYFLNRLRDHAQNNDIPNEWSINQVKKDLKKICKDFDRTYDELIVLNKPTILDEDKGKALESFSRSQFRNRSGRYESLLSEEDVQSLSVLRGSLTPEELAVVQSHVTHSYEFLKKIPWLEKFAEIPEIAYGHHELLDGTGYPRKLRGQEISIKVRMMTICDIFDALVANDRAYKPAIPFARAFAILKTEAQNGRLDQELLDVFLEHRIYETPEFVELLDGIDKKRQAA